MVQTYADITFRKNNVINQDVNIAPDAQRAAIHDNIFDANMLLQQPDVDKPRLESALSYMELVFEEHWKSLPDATRKANEELLSRFERSAGEIPINKTLTQAFLQAVIDVTPK